MKLIESQGDLRQKLTVGSRREKCAFIQRTRNEATEEIYQGMQDLPFLGPVQNVLITSGNSILLQCAPKT